VREGDRVVLREELHQTARKEVASRLGKEEGATGRRRRRRHRGRRGSAGWKGGGRGVGMKKGDRNTQFP
jgi:IS5 family transposase